MASGYQRCFGAKLRGRKFRTKASHKAAIRAAARACGSKKKRR